MTWTPFRSSLFLLLAVAGMAAHPTGALGQDPPGGAGQRSAGRQLRDAYMRGVLAAGGDSLADTWDGTCRDRVENPEMRTRTVYLTLHHADGATPLPTVVLTYVAQEIAGSLMRAERQTDGRLRLLPADDTFSPEILRSRAEFTLRRHGELVDVDLSRVQHASLERALRAAFDSVAARGGVGGLGDAASLDAYALELAFIPEMDPTRSLAPLFTLQVPVNRQASPMPENRPPPYPHVALNRGAQAVVILKFVVNPDGTVRPESITSVPPPTPVSPELQPTFEMFERTAIETARTYRYRPAEYLGCRVATWVTQPFEFKLH